MTIYDERGVPVLYRGPDQKIGLSEDAHENLTDAADKTAVALEDRGVDAYDEHYLIGHSVIVHASNLADSRQPSGAGEGRVNFTIGAETLDEAVKSVIGAYDIAHIHPRDESSDHLFPPDWVASTHSELGRLLADYYSCEQRDIAEVL